jgi:hypothetical protein
MTQNRWRRYVGLAAGVGLIAVVLTSTSAGPAIAQTFKPVMAFITNDVNSPVPVRTVASNLSHVGRPANDLLQLIWNGSTCFVRQAPTGVPEPDCYLPESGRTAVITDIYWRTPTSSPAGAPHLFILAIRNQRPTFVGSTLVLMDGLVFGDRSLQAGFIFHPDLQVRSEFAAEVQLYGYSVPSE